MAGLASNTIFPLFLWFGKQSVKNYKAFLLYSSVVDVEERPGGSKYIFIGKGWEI